jgi:hypothetical protein
MRSSTRRRALESAGKIALGCYFGAVGAGCGGLSQGGAGTSAELEPPGSEPAPSAMAPDAAAPEPSGGAPDAAAPEPSGGAPDAAAPEPSAMAPDAAAPDAAAPDAATPDAAAPDAAAPDAAAPAPTAMAPDAGAPEPTEPTPVLACIAPVEVSDRRLITPLGLEEEACCKAYVEGVAGADPTLPELALDASLFNCCRALAYDGTFDTSVAHTLCCYGDVLPIEDRQASYCSPWGPPVPPALGIA